MNDDTAFIAALDATPDDWAMRLVYADWLEERGECVKANGQRWMVENFKCPESGPLSRTSFSDHWHWWGSGVDDTDLPGQRALLPDLLHKYMREASWAYKTRTAAENALAEAIDRLRIFVDPLNDTHPRPSR